MIHKMRLVDQAKNLISGSISNGSFCIDLTCGNGLDTYFLAQLVGETGKVFAFDLQEEAVQRTRDYLIGKQSLSRCLLFQTCHSGFHSYIPVFHKGKVSAVMMNLGYLPRGKQKIITYPHTTENLDEMTNFREYQTEFLKLFGFGLEEVNYDEDVDLVDPFKSY